MGRRASGFMPPCVSAIVVVSAVALMQAQGTPPRQPALAEDVFENVQALRGIPVDEFMDTMGMFSAATGLNCAHCHAIDNGGGGKAMPSRRR